MARARPGSHLAGALSEARKAADVLERDLVGGQDENGRPWRYASPEEVSREAARLLDAFKLEIRFLGQTMTNAGNVRTRYLLLHLPSMDSDVVVLEAPPNGPGPLGVAWTLEQSRRLVRLHVLDIRTADPPKKDEEALFHCASGTVRFR